MTALTYFVVCRSCRYRREWPTVLEAIVDALRHRAENQDHQVTALPPS